MDCNSIKTLQDSSASVGMTSAINQSFLGRPIYQEKAVMKDGIREILGKTITGVIAKERAGVPQSQVFLLFSDNTWFELYCTDSVISGTGGLWEGGMDEVRKYMSETSSIVLDAELD